jgi:hypothetical protein
VHQLQQFPHLAHQVPHLPSLPFVAQVQPIQQACQPLASQRVIGPSNSVGALGFGLACTRRRARIFPRWARCRRIHT